MEKLFIYARFVKFEHTLFSLPLLFAGALLAGRQWPFWTLSVLILGAGTGARTVAFALNRIIDRKIDALNPRTALRELPKGRMSLVEAWGIACLGMVLYVGCAWAIAPICLYASPLPVLVFVIYPYLKRFTPFAHLGVGLADAFAPLGGYVAVTKSLHPFWPGLLLALFTFFWVSGFDIIYATLDETFDKANRVYSMVSAYGKKVALLISGILHIFAFCSLAILYCYSFRTSPYAGLAMMSLLTIGALLFWEYWTSDQVDLAFFKINSLLGFGVLGFVAAGIVL